MSTSYPGNPTATEAPAAQPSPGVLPIGVIPADGEAANVASITQSFKVLLDYVAWLMKPLAKAAQWALPTWQVQTPNGFNRWTLDHAGFQSWGIQSIRETWNTSELVGGSTSNGDFTKLTVPWHWSVVGTQSIQITSPITATGQSPHFKSLWLSVDSFNGASASVGIPQMMATYDTGNTISMEWAACMDAIGANNITWITGLRDGAPPSTTRGAYFRKLSTDTNWQCVCNDGAAETVVDSGYTPTANAFDRFKIVWSGSAVDDSAASRVLFYINGSLKANITANLPTFQATAHFIGTQTAASVVRRLSIGPVWLTANDGPLSWQ